MANPTKLSWTGPTKNTDGSDFTADQYAGFELQVNSENAVSIPKEWAPDGKYSLPLADFSAVQKQGAHTLRMRTIAKNGNTSDWSTPVTFLMDFRVPTAPIGLSVG